jgi:hypothetical protein
LRRKDFFGSSGRHLSSWLITLSGVTDDKEKVKGGEGDGEVEMRRKREENEGIDGGID